MFNEAELEKLVVDTIAKNGWEYIPAEQLPRRHSDVMIEPFVRDALIRLNPEIAEQQARADEVIYKLRSLILAVQPHDLVAQNERFKKLVFEENSFPFGKDGRMIPIRFFGTGTKDAIALNRYTVTNQWVFPKEDGGKRLDVVALINGFPVAIGEMKTPTRNAVMWLDGAGDISAYEKSIPQMFVTNVFNFATEGKCYCYGSVCMPINLWGPWHTPHNKHEGTLADVARSIVDMFTPDKVMDIFQFFTLFATETIMEKVISGENFTPNEWMAIMPPLKFSEMLNDHYEMGKRSGTDDKRDEVICRLLAAGMSEEVAVVLCVKADTVSEAVKHRSEIIKTYARQLKARRKRRERRSA
jgi:type I restriction enzyme R subunit